jgi:hypothetical protein
MVIMFYIYALVVNLQLPDNYLLLLKFQILKSSLALLAIAFTILLIYSH